MYQIQHIAQACLAKTSRLQQWLKWNPRGHYWITQQAIYPCPQSIPGAPCREEP